ncbi:MAG TPA: hypothetical protein DEQ41_03895 [Shewanella sp.]|nr:hypothetical protein [Shewanella sp.]
MLGIYGITAAQHTSILYMPVKIKEYKNSFKKLLYVRYSLLSAYEMLLLYQLVFYRSLKSLHSSGLHYGHMQFMPARKL